MLTTYYPNGQPYIVENRINGIRNGEVKIYNITGQIINIIKYDNLQIYRIEYKQNGFLHNLHGPAYMRWYDGKILFYVYHFGKLIKKYAY